MTIIIHNKNERYGTEKINYQIITYLALSISLVLIAILVFILINEFKDNLKDSLLWMMYIYLALVLITGGTYEIIILRNKSDTILSKIIENDSTDSNAKTSSNELKDIRRHHLAERYMEEVYPAFLRNNVNDKEAIKALNLQICKILGHNSNMRCIVSMEKDIITVVISNDNDKKLKLVYNKGNKELNVDSTDSIYTLNNNIGITVKNNKINYIELM